ncbi:MAG: amino acid permease [Gammaproteobacteria bacterium]|nr:amino acid permease [Gammaproteobacteria bacterium]MBV9696119.1 amino acid permease [Gammaproteobacteria bacterium]
MLRQLLATKSIAELHEQESSGNQLRRALSATQLTLLGVGGIIGTGIFVLTGVAAANYAGPALALSFIIAGIGCALAGLCYAEFAAMIPVSGSAYSYSYATLGEGVAWFIGWNLVLEYLFAVATVSVGWSGYAVSLLEQWGIHLSPALTNAPFTSMGDSMHIVRTGAIINVPAMVIVGLIGTVCYIGIRESASFNSVIVTIKVTIIALFVVFGVSYVNTANWHPFIPANTGQFGSFGLSGVGRAAAVIFFAYIGFDAISTAAQEAKNPQRDMPIGILASLVICTVLYVIVALVLTGMVNYAELNVAAPVALALDKYQPLHWLGQWVKLGAVAGMTSVMLVMTIAQARIFFAMARDGLLPSFFGRVQPRFRTPSTGTVITAVTAAVFGGLFPVSILANVVSIGTLSAFVTVCLGVLILRRTRPDLPRPFRTPLPYFTCIAGALVCFALMVLLGAPTWWRLLIWTIVGVAVYLLYGRRHSALRRANDPSGRGAAASAN